MVAADTFVVIGSSVVVERADGKVEHTVVQTFVLQDILVGIGSLVGKCRLTLMHEVAVIEVTLVNAPQIDKAHRSNDSDGIGGLEPAAYCQHEDNRPRRHDKQAAQRVRR